jgi:hypothetical protein
MMESVKRNTKNGAQIRHREHLLETVLHRRWAFEHHGRGQSKGGRGSRKMDTTSQKAG